MPRARKPRQESPSTEEGEQQQRPSQLAQIREAISAPPKTRPEDAEAPELPSAEEPEAETAPAEEPAEPAPAVAAAVAVVAEPVTAPWVPPPTTPPPPPPTAQRTSPPRNGTMANSSLAVGIVLVVVGVFFLVIRLLDIDLSSYGWPLYVIIPGLTLLVAGFVSLGPGALIPGGIITVFGLVLAYQSATDDWASWAYAWALVAPGGVGLGVFLQGLRVHDSRLTRQGRGLMFWSVLIFLIGFVFFESILNLSGHDYGKLGQAALPVLLIIIGVTLLVRNFQRGRSA